MGDSKYTKKDLEFFFQRVEWADIQDVSLWFTGTTERFGWAEKHTKAMADRRKLLVRKDGHRLIYAAPNRWKGKKFIPDESVPEALRKELEERFYQVEHGLAVTREIVLMWRSSMADSQIIDSREFIGLGVKPDWAFRYRSSQNILLGEHITEDYFYRTTLIKLKIRKYTQHLEDIQEHFLGKSTAVLFVIDIPIAKVQQFVSRLVDIDARFFFTSFEVFLQAEVGKHLSSPIYIWGRDGKTYPLGSDE